MQVVTKQISGLGNQLFQYAAGLYFARRYGASLRMAVDSTQNRVSHGYPRPFLLSHFNIPIPMHPLTATERVLFSEKKSIRPLANLYKRYRGIQIFAEPVSRRYTFIEDVPLQRSVRLLYLAGYWQAHGMVDAVASELRRDLQFRSPPDGRNLESIAEIKETHNSVSLHMRRGDFTLAAEGNIALPLSYYADAIRYFQARLGEPTFFVFSDDPAFARKNLPGDAQAIFVDHNDDSTSYEDIRLMSACRHHIIANSSFSWWGAWLNSRPDKLVYAPRYWQLNAGSYYPGLFPPDWTIGDFPPRT